MSSTSRRATLRRTASRRSSAPQSPTGCNASSHPTDTDPSTAFPQLTERELEILQLLAQRKTNAQIAAELYLSQKTVRNYVSAIFAKLQVTDRAEAGLIARTAGLGTQQADTEQ